MLRRSGCLAGVVIQMGRASVIVRDTQPVGLAAALCDFWPAMSAPYCSLALRTPCELELLTTSAGCLNSQVTERKDLLHEPVVSHRRRQALAIRPAAAHCRRAQNSSIVAALLS